MRRPRLDLTDCLLSPLLLNLFLIDSSLLNLLPQHDVAVNAGMDARRITLLIKTLYTFYLVVL
jgi:hypothetical protein